MAFKERARGSRLLKPCVDVRANRTIWPNGHSGMVDKRETNAFRRE